MAQPISTAVPLLRTEIETRRQLRVAVAVIARDPATRFGQMPHDITQYVVLPFVPDLRCDTAWMLKSIVEAKASQEDFLSHYAARDDEGYALFEDGHFGEHTPVLSIAALDDHCSTVGLVAGQYAYAKQAGDWFVLNTTSVINMINDEHQYSVSHPRGIEFSDCIFNGVALQTVCEDEAQDGIIPLDDPKYVSIPNEYFTVVTLLPCGLMVTKTEGGEYQLRDPVARKFLAITPIDDSCHYDDFGASIAKPDGLEFFNQFDPAFGQFVPE